MTPSDPIAPWPLVKRGAKVFPVRSLQQLLRGVQEVMKFHDQSGGAEGGGVQIDGIFGPKTDAFVCGFQEALEITVDGIVGPVTWRALASGMLSG